MLKGLVGLIAGITVMPCFAQHYHVNAGAVALETSSKLLFVNGAEFATNSGFFVRMPTNNPAFAGEYTGGISLTALSADPLAPEPGHALPGAYLEVVVESVEGPAGGAISFWQRPEGEPESRRVFSVSNGTAGGTNRFNLSESDGSPGSDPFGHIHGRNFSASEPGLYRVGLRIIDTSVNGPNGGPLHEASDLFYLWFQAGVLLQPILVEDGTGSIIYPAVAGQTWQLESTETLGTIWQPLGEAVAGDDRFRTVEVSPIGMRFYRLRGSP